MDLGWVVDVNRILVQDLALTSLRLAGWVDICAFLCRAGRKSLIPLHGLGLGFWISLHSNKAPVLFLCVAQRRSEPLTSRAFVVVKEDSKGVCQVLPLSERGGWLKRESLGEVMLRGFV
ncbi:hypothetical protein NM208_g15400 [Fusarium decemcellulare]|uniref:Uncharacterized protein n=1 Tax=Fusarium decemcellulare TaxID=57161 RepID=A0ACC1RDQ0_9HYPO|nr:hypothetical protein NM208_g15400 [Fusarium decemcellulare]